MDNDNHSPLESFSALQLWAKRNINLLFSKDTWTTFGEYMGLGRPVSNQPITAFHELVAFVASRSSHVAQSTLYGYLKTRAGTRFTTLFENEDMLSSINLAKWHVYVACISDLAAYIGVLLHLRTGTENARIVRVMSEVVDRIIEDIGMPEEAGDNLGESLEAMTIRIRNMDFTAHEDGEDIFSVSPGALYRWAPIADNLKRFDKIPVENSVRFKWKDVRDRARALLDAETLLANEHHGQSSQTGA